MRKLLLLFDSILNLEKPEQLSFLPKKENERIESASSDTQIYCSQNNVSLANKAELLPWEKHL